MHHAAPPGLLDGASVRRVARFRHAVQFRVKRFYTDGDASVATTSGFTVLLDGRPVRTPARAPAHRADRAPLAEAIAAEWAGQPERIDTQDMRLTRLATTVVDLMPARRGDAIAEAAGYAATDLLCYRAAGPASLAAPPGGGLAALARLGRAALRCPAAAGRGRDADQPGRGGAARPARGGRAGWTTGAWSGCTPPPRRPARWCSGSRSRRASSPPIGRSRVALLDELYEIEQWGEDAEQSARHARLRADLVAAERFLELLP